MGPSSAAGWPLPCELSPAHRTHPPPSLPVARPLAPAHAEAEYEEDVEGAIHYTERDGADGVAAAGFLVTADDFSTVKLFNYPVVADDAPYKAFRGHASFVESVR